MGNDKNKNAERLLQKLERYEQEAYNGEFGSDWLEDIGEGFKFYVEECAAENKPVTIKGFEKHIDAMRNGKAVAGYKH